MNVTISVSVASIDEAEQLLRNLRAGLGSAPLALTVAAAAPAPAKAPRKSKAAPAPVAEVVDDDPLGTAVEEYAASNGEGDDLDLSAEAPAAAPAKAAPKPAANVTPETIKLRVRELVEAGEMARVQAAFAKVGAKKFSEIPEAKLGAVFALLKD